MEFDLSHLTPDIRRLNDMREVIYDKEWLKTANDSELYYMYRGLEEVDGLRYDITVIPAKMLGSEFVKTKGHCHIGRWREVYTVLEGTAIYLMQAFATKKQKNDPSESPWGGNEDKIDDVYFVKSKKGESIIIPEGYGHVTINPSKSEELKMANWVSEDCKSDYSKFEKLNGACYHYIKQGWAKNENYKSVSPLRFEESSKFVPENLDFLK